MTIGSERAAWDGDLFFSPRADKMSGQEEQHMEPVDRAIVALTRARVRLALMRVAPAALADVDEALEILVCLEVLQRKPGAVTPEAVPATKGTESC